MVTSRASPTPASQAENTSKISGIIEIENIWKWVITAAIKINSDSIIPSRQSRVDIKCER